MLSLGMMYFCTFTCFRLDNDDVDNFGSGVPDRGDPEPIESKQSIGALKRFNKNNIRGLHVLANQYVHDCRLSVTL